MKQSVNFAAFILLGKGPCTGRSFGKTLNWAFANATRLSLAKREKHAVIVKVFEEWGLGTHYVTVCLSLPLSQLFCG